MKTILKRLAFCYSISQNWISFFRLINAYLKFSILIRQGAKGRQKLQNQQSFTIQTKINGSRREMKIRVQDMVIFYEIFEELVYQNQLAIDDKDWIIDLGANVGFSAIYFHHYIPTYKSIICVEPSKQNIPLLSFNTKAISYLIIRKEGIDTYDGEANFSDSEFGHLSKVEDGKASDYIINVRTLSTLIREHDIKSIGLLKIDIEGKEEAILHDNVEWLSIVKNIVIEIHDFEFEKVLDQIMVTNGFQKEVIKEDIFWYTKISQ